MLEKSGTITLTTEDLNELHAGKVSERVQSTWGLTLQQLQEIVAMKSYVLHSAAR